MRTTIDLPEPLHRVARSLALHTGRSLSETVVELMTRGLAAPAQASSGPMARHETTGLPVSRSRRVVTPEDVAALDDEA